MTNNKPGTPVKVTKAEVSVPGFMTDVVPTQEGVSYTVVVKASRQGQEGRGRRQGHAPHDRQGEGRHRDPAEGRSAVGHSVSKLERPGQPGRFCLGGDARARGRARRPAHPDPLRRRGRGVLGTPLPAGEVTGEGPYGVGTGVAFAPIAPGAHDARSSRAPRRPSTGAPGRARRRGPRCPSSWPRGRAGRGPRASSGSGPAG